MDQPPHLPPLRPLPPTEPSAAAVPDAGARLAA
jgi:hypothetical protein